MIVCPCGLEYLCGTINHKRKDMEKKEKLLPQLLAYAGKKKILTYLSMIIAGIGQLLALAPFIYIWAIIRDVIGGDYSRIAHYSFKRFRTSIDEYKKWVIAYTLDLRSPYAYRSRGRQDSSPQGRSG